MSCGEPDAQEWARPVRQAGRGNGPAATPAPRPGPTRPLAEGDDARLVLVEGKTPGRQPAGEPGLDLECLLPGVAEDDEVVGVPDRCRAALRDPSAPPAALLVPDSGGLLHPVQGDVQQQRADHTALRNAVLGAVQPALLDHARLQPLRNHSPGGERAEHGQDVVVRELVECLCQIGVQRPQAVRASALDDLVDGLDRVVAAAARPKPVGPRLEPGLPLGLQRVDDTCLVAPVGDHGNSERPALGAAPCLGDVHAPDRHRLERLGRLVHPVGQSCFGLRGEHHLAVHARRQTTGVALRHPPHADQRVRARSEHQLLQVADLLQVPSLRRREDPLPQPPYVFLHPPPVDGVPVEGRVLWSVHHADRGRRGVQLVLGFRGLGHLSPHRLT